ncbi:hypothetical protein [Saccharicrinis aurantiacus]|uniref:hypothetical protein n=1 Tax=Saccharicrinis aurantiacus TaxID=1849719 RepID=UPI00094FF94B|nr:hypothetical protein [Saccharicrinis aurantiacus]
MKRILIATVAALTTLLSCNKDKIDSSSELVTNSEDITLTSESIATTEASVDDAVEAAEYEVELFSGSESSMESLTIESSSNELLKSTEVDYRRKHESRYRSGECPNITISSEEGGFPRTVILDYGDSTELTDGRIISGEVEIVLSNKDVIGGSTRTITYNNFTVDDVNMNGTSVKSFTGGKTEDKVVNIVSDLVIVLPEGVTINRTAEKIRTWSTGLDTPEDHSDDVMEITGWADCEDSDGNTYRRDITTPLVKKGDCRFVVSGEVNITKGDNTFATINYGDGECDNIAVVTTEEESKEITIGEHKRDKIERAEVQNEE